MIELDGIKTRIKWTCLFLLYILRTRLHSIEVHPFIALVGWIYWIETGYRQEGRVHHMYIIHGYFYDLLSM
jgi:hypothetical protein